MCLFSRIEQLVAHMLFFQIDDRLGVEVAGDAERKHVKLVQEVGGIPYHPNQIKNAVSFKAH